MILIIGDAMIDKYWKGEVSRISPEAPVPVVAVSSIEERMGGAANVAANIQAMGGVVSTCFSPSFYDNPVAKLRVIGRSQQMVRLDFDNPQVPISIGEYRAKLKDAEIVVISDYGKGALKDIDILVQTAKESGKTILVDPKGHRYTKYRGADMVKPNLHEMRELVGGWESEEELEEKILEMKHRAEIKAILLTRGEQGMTLYAEKTTHIPTEAREVYDVSGAGDTAIAAYAVSLERGMGEAEAARYANRAAGLACGHFGTAVIGRAEVFGD